MEVKIHNIYGLELAAARAWACQSGRPPLPEKYTQKELYGALKHAISSGHNTILEHIQIALDIYGISRALSFEIANMKHLGGLTQLSQRHVPVERFVIPDISENLKEEYKAVMLESIDAYNKIQKLLELKCGKQSIEISRSILPLCAETEMYLTINGLTLHRFYKTLNSGDNTKEKKKLWLKIEEGLKNSTGKDILTFFDKPFPKEEITENKIYDTALANGRISDNNIRQWHENEAPKTKEETMLMCLNTLFPTMKVISSDCEMLVNPKNNIYLLDQTDSGIVTPFGKFGTEDFVKMEMSHAGAHQLIRNRGMLNVAQAYFTISKDFEVVIPNEIKENPEAYELFSSVVTRQKDLRNKLIGEGFIEEAVYPLPNAVKIKVASSTAPFIDIWHLMLQRSCNKAQEEVRNIVKGRITQKKEEHPDLFKYAGPPCLSGRCYEKTPCAKMFKEH